jgi:hypothetical protein
MRADSRSGPAPPVAFVPMPAAPGSETAIERRGDLKAKGILTDAELATKKAELLARL